ncbi:hypothetical protein RHMOL_Rhmol05G0032300 [Rhododendron molle]|uniref:Uncharacterized protein n=1 Tax=Rhododendron molle TaxID=49168 RepID=A0ACC0NLG1_RHOML|nr:hypothetical protein RHMOL_Rhmol05G0032300 [Rhododendron molle]
MGLTATRGLIGDRRRMCRAAAAAVIDRSREIRTDDRFDGTNLHELVLKNAWLSTKGLSSAMLKLTSLTLAFVRLDDEGLYNVNSCCPS